MTKKSELFKQAIEQHQLMVDEILFSRKRIKELEDKLKSRPSIDLGRATYSESALDKLVDEVNEWVRRPSDKKMDEFILNLKKRYIVKTRIHPHVSYIKFPKDFKSVRDANGLILNAHVIENTLHGIGNIALPIHADEAIYYCDEQAGSVAYDSSGNGLHASY